MVWNRLYSEKELERKLFLILFLIGLENEGETINNKKKTKRKKNSNNSVTQAQSNSLWSATKFSIFVNNVNKMK